MPTNLLVFSKKSFPSSTTPPFFVRPPRRAPALLGPLPSAAALCSSARSLRRGPALPGALPAPLRLPAAAPFHFSPTRHSSLRRRTIRVLTATPFRSQQPSGPLPAIIRSHYPPPSRPTTHHHPGPRCYNPIPRFTIALFPPRIPPRIC